MLFLSREKNENSAKKEKYRSMLRSKLFSTAAGDPTPRLWFREQPSHSAVASGSSIPSSSIQRYRKCLVFPTGCRGTRWIAPDHFRPSLLTGQRVWTSCFDRAPPPPSSLSFFYLHANFQTRKLYDHRHDTNLTSSRSLLPSKLYFTPYCPAFSHDSRVCDWNEAREVIS